MRKILILIILIVTMSSVWVYGDVNRDKVANTTLLQKTSKPSRPQAPNINSIRCTYLCDVLNFDFPEYVEYALVEINDGVGMLVASEVVYAADPALEVSLTEGEYEITCRTDGNQIFSGAIYIQ